ncbi:MAG: aldo/keto reductase [Gemmatimonadetes bacterium]|nr:aldo/keto reductase [Gemmatimonadota bacterium]MYA77820.1 aldo/keto reductase [Gemmatimonadota bacterium]MYG16497.1 aldo/keto reductase [Gemmatimonadota bacterium]MYH18559.1 aldo/keto reductase [Gemmatimonadota bacterium]MYK97439.1 aldo/keto reductase [Gemmatimonadota bacterium]
MEHRKLGRTDTSLSFIGLGCVTFGREIDEDASAAILDDAVERGINWLDTAEAYGGGNARTYRRDVLKVDDVRETSDIMGSSEIIIGKWMKARGCRDDVVICSKVSSGNSPENIARALRVSLERLQVDCVDIYELHSPDESVPIAESLAALDEEVSAGRIGTVGCSNFNAAQLREALDASAREGYARFEVVQPPYNLADPGAQDELFPLCRREEVAITSYSPLAAGFLAGKYTPDLNAFPKGSRFDVIPGHADIYFNDRNFRNVERLRALADNRGIPMVRMAMAWAMGHPDITSVLVGARHAGHLDNAFDALALKADTELRDEMSSWLAD